MAEVAEANPTSYEVADLASDVAGQSRRLATLVEDLLLLARADEAGLALSTESFDIAEVIDEEVQSSGGPSIDVDTTGVASIRLVGDRRRIGQVLRNLIDNAIRHAHRTISIEAMSDNEDVLIVVSDDGPGIPGVDRQRIFERFVRLDESRNREVGGTGLGLAVVRTIVEAHGGTATVGDSADLGGASVSVRLPTSKR
jgi:signal transduction histidine kinase